MKTPPQNQTPFPYLLVWELLKDNLRATENLRARLDHSAKLNLEALKQDIARLKQRLNTKDEEAAEKERIFALLNLLKGEK
jgi:hypothetical protein